jgi:transposase
MEELGIECLVGHPAQICTSAPRKQKNDRRDAELILKMLVEGRFPAIWLPSKELQDLRALLQHRHQWVRMTQRNGSGRKRRSSCADGEVWSDLVVKKRKHS